MKKKILILIVILFLVTGCHSDKSDKELNVLNWSSYIPNELIKDFENEYHIKVNYNTYSSNEELLAKVSSSKKGTYDVVFPSDYMVELMITRNMLEKIDLSRFHNLSNINNLFLNQPFDIDNTYSLPFLLATTVIAYDKESIHEEIKSYNDLLDLQYKENIVLLDDQRITIGMSLLANGYSMNDTNDEHLKKAKEWLLKLKKNVKAYDSDSPKTFLITDETDIGVMWNAEAELAKMKNNNIEIIYPNDGFALSLDNYVILKGSKNIDNAYLFIDYLLRDDVNKKIIDEYPYISVNTNNSFNLDEFKNIFNRGSYVKNIGNVISYYDRIWAEIK